MHVYARSFISLMLVALLNGSGPAAAQSLRERAREHYQLHPDVPFQPGLLGEYFPKTLESLTAEAEVVLQARLSRIGSYLTSNEERILTDYSIQEAHVIAGRLPVLRVQVPGKVAPLILSVYGGEVTVDGLLIRNIDHNLGAIHDGRQYLLFLKPSRSSEAGRYEIYYGGVFEILQESVRPLLWGAENIFKGVGGIPVKDLIQQIGKAALAR